MTPPHRLAIVGSGMAGARLAEHVRGRSQPGSFDIVVFGEEPGGTYNRILLPGVLAGTHAGPDIVTNPVEWYAANDITLESGVRVERIDVGGRAVVDARGVRHRFDSLVLATGSRPMVPAIEGLVAHDGSLMHNAFVFRTIDDCARMAVAAASARRAVVIGGGLLGLEAARALLGYGLEVTVVHLGAHLMDAQLDPDGGAVLRRQLTTLGLRTMTGTFATAVSGTDRVTAVRFGDGSALECDLLVVAAGVRPNVELAERAGLALGQRGIVVGDDLGCPGAPGLYAIGDCAEHRGQAYGLVAPAWQQADVLADRLTGARPDALYEGSRLATKLKVAGVHVAVMGDRDPDADDEVVTYSELSRGIYSRLIVRGDRVAGAILIGAASMVPSIVQRFLDGSAVPEARAELLFPPTGDAPARSVDQIPDAARICDCNAVVKEQIVEAVLNGARSLSAVCERTRAGTGCGSCRPEVQRIVDFTCRQVGDAPVAAAAAAGAARRPSEGLMRPLDGQNVALLESRKAADLAGLVARFGGTPICVSSVREMRREGDAGPTLTRLRRDGYELVVLLTAAACDALFQDAERLGVLDEAIQAMRRTRIACRGPKPLLALKRRGLASAILTAKPHTTDDLVDALAAVPLDGATVLVLHYGERSDAFSSALADRGAVVEDLCLYEWALPDDLQPLDRLVRDTIAGSVQIMLFTSQVQLRHLLLVARRAGLDGALVRALRDDVIVASVGPVCSRALRAEGIVPDVMPASPNSPSLVQAVADYVSMFTPNEETPS